jgi:hypothetical protein
MILNSLSISQVAQVNKYIRLKQMMDSRLNALWQNEIVNSEYNHIEQMSERYNAILEKGSNWCLDRAYNAVYRKFVKVYGLTVKDHLARYITPRKPYENNGGNFRNVLVQVLAKNSKDTKAAEWRYRLIERCRQADLNNEYVIFDTLTVDKEHYEKVFQRDSNHWRNYIERFARLCNGRHEYFASTERGTGTLRLHLHVIHFCGQKPKGITDPNKGSCLPIKREITSLKKLWPYGNTSPIAVRWSISDTWAQAGWKWPVEESGVPIDRKPLIATARYVAKYVTKTNQRKDIPWRVKATRNLGLNNLKTVLSSLAVRDIYLLTKIGASNIVKESKKSRIPNSLIRKIAIKILNERLTESKTYRKLIGRQKTQVRLISRLASLMKKIRNYNRQKCGNLNNPRVIYELFGNAFLVPPEELYDLLPKLSQKLAKSIKYRTAVTAASII